MQFTTKVAGIPCQCRVTHFTNVIPAKVDGPPEDCYPAEGGEFEYDILDRRGRKAPWLEKKLKPEDDDRLYFEFNLECRAEDYQDPYINTD
jgi:hypothetical protein